MRGMIDGALDMDLRYPVPKTIKNHPGVQDAEEGPPQGIDYKWAVFLKPGWAFERGRMAGIRSGNFNSVASFRLAHPIKVTP